MQLRSFGVAALLVSGAVNAQNLGTWSRQNISGAEQAVHLTLLPDKSLMAWYARTTILTGYPNYNYAFYEDVPDYTDHNIFCSGHTFLEDGKLFVAGGHDHMNDNGINDTWIFDYASGSDPRWSQGLSMQAGRWYPTTVMLPDRRVLILSGTDMDMESMPPVIYTNEIPEMWVNNVPVSGQYMASLAQKFTESYYPHMFVDPTDGNLVFLGHGHGAASASVTPNQKLNLRTLAWTNAASLPNTWDETENIRAVYASSVMIDGTVYRSGGAYYDPDPGNSVFGPATANTIYYNFTATTPAWAQGPAMNYARKNHTLVGLPNGYVLAVGGSSENVGEGADDRSTPEWWNPNAGGTPAWHLLQSQSSLPTPGAIGRGYHSTALLLPDARVAFAGGHDDTNADMKVVDIFSPPYGGTNSWASTRPTISSLSSSTIRYDYPFVNSDFTFTVGLESGRTLSKVVLVSLGTTTHSHNQNQNIVTLSKSVSGSTVTVTPPSSTWVAKPGPYMLFALDSEGIPSVAEIVFLKDFSMILPTSATVSVGTTNTSPALAELYLGENSYLGNVLTSNSSGQAETIFEGTAHSASAELIRGQVELHTSSTSFVEIYFWHWGDEEWHQAGTTGIAGTTDWLMSVPRYDYTTNDAAPYIRSSDKKVKMKLVVQSWSEEPVDIYIDTAEIGIR